MTQEEKAKRYDEAIKKAESLYKVSEPMSGCNVIIETLFPELKENEDEKTKRILHSISSKMSFHLRDIFTEEEFQCFDAWSNAWLEKQGQVRCTSVGKKEATGVLKEMLDDEGMKEQKQEWSEEDEKNLEKTIWYVEKGGKLIFAKIDKLVPWLKSLKERVTPQPKQEWSEEDENTRKKIIKFLKEQNYFDGKANEFKEPYKKEYEWLKSLRPQNTWKPSDEQIEALHDTIIYVKDSMFPSKNVLKKLYGQLKKLREE